jgi:hypothetical protein
MGGSIKPLVAACGAGGSYVAKEKNKVAQAHCITSHRVKRRGHAFWHASNFVVSNQHVATQQASPYMWGKNTP